MVECLHKMKYTHTDLKPDNIVFRYQNKLNKKFIKGIYITIL